MARPIRCLMIQLRTPQCGARVIDIRSGGRSALKMKEAAAEFLAHKRVAVTGVSRHPNSHGSNVDYQRLRERGYDAFAVNPNAEVVEGDPAYHDLCSIPG